MKVHKRYFIVGEASSELSLSIIDIIKKFDLTYGEILKLLGEKQAVFASYLIRDERHPNSDKKGDEA